jgi:hypothetical protein
VLGDLNENEQKCRVQKENAAQGEFTVVTGVECFEENEKGIRLHLQFEMERSDKFA